MRLRTGFCILLAFSLFGILALGSNAEHGMTLVLRASAGYEEELVTYNLYRLADIGVNSLCILAMWFMDDLEDPTLEPWYLDEPGFPDAGFFYPTLRDEQIAFIVDVAHSLGMSVMLKLSAYPLDWASRGSDAPGHEAFHPAGDDWDQLFASYKVFLDHYAALSEQLGIETLCIGCELESMTIPGRGVPDPDRRWRALIASARELYRGALTYSTAFGGLFPQPPGTTSQEAITFWDALDYIGIEFYAGVSTGKDPAYQALLENMRWMFETFYEPLARTYSLPILIPEAAFASFDGANVSIEPSRTPYDMKVSDYEEQADCHRALLQVIRESEYVNGIYWWAGTLLYPNDGHRWQTTGTDFYLWGKPVESILRDAWEGSRPFGEATAVPVRAIESEDMEPGTAFRMSLPAGPGSQVFVRAVPADGWWFDHWDGPVDLPSYPIAKLDSSAGGDPTAVFRRSPCSSCTTGSLGIYEYAVVDGFSRGTRSLYALDAFWATAGSQGFTEPEPSTHAGYQVMSYRYPENGDQKLFLKFETRLDASGYDGVEVVIMADAPTSVRVEIASQDPGLAGRMNEDNWKTMYPSCSLPVTEDWKTFRLPFRDFILDPDELLRFPGVSPALMDGAVLEIQFFVEDLGREIWIQRVAFYHR
jgi:hypothetical protein